METEEKRINSLDELLEIANKRNKGFNGKKKTLEKHYGCLIRGIDGMEYQKACRSE
jgi:hypothetical protein